MKAALIGAGMVSGTYASAFRQLEGLRLACVYARSAERRLAFAAEHSDLGVVPVDSISSITNDPTIDFVILATPPDARLEIARALADAGKPVLMEKPVARSLREATHVVEICEAAQVPLGIVLQHRARPVVAELQARLPQMGELCAVEVAVPWWRDQSYYDAPGRGSYARDGGGVLISQAIHTLDLMLTLAGEVAEVTATAATTRFHRMEAEDFVTAGLRFSNGAVGHVFATTASFPGRGETITLHCANASAHLEAGQLDIAWQDGRRETLGQSAASGAGADPMAFTSDWHATLIRDFADAVSAGRAPMVPGRDALAVHRLIDALERSAQEGARIELE